MNWNELRSMIGDDKELFDLFINDNHFHHMSDLIRNGCDPDGVMLETIKVLCNENRKMKDELIRIRETGIIEVR